MSKGQISSPSGSEGTEVVEYRRSARCDLCFLVSAAAEPLDQLLSSDVPPELDTMALEGNRSPAQGLHPSGLLGELEALSSRMTPMELSSLSPQQLVDIHAHLGGMMSRMVAEMQTRLQKL